MKNKVAEKQPSSAKKLATAVKEVWGKEISTGYTEFLVKDMPSRLVMIAAVVFAVVREKDGHTEYAKQPSF